jgi:ABC-type lipoprotein export system ATPase subunit
MMGGLSRPSRGSVRIGNIDIWALPDDRLAEFRNRRIGFVYQFASLLPTLRIIDNVVLPARLDPEQDVAAAFRRGRELLDQFGLSDYLEAYPSEISSGEQRRAVIARALINEPALLLADEPTSDLDEVSETQIVDWFRGLNRERGLTLIMVTHNLRLAEQTDRVIHISDGRLAA